VKRKRIEGILKTEALSFVSDAQVRDKTKMKVGL
jgi:hypothetical protein